MELVDRNLERCVIRSIADAAQLDGLDRARLMLDGERLSFADFGMPAHAETFHAVAQLVADGSPPDPFSAWAKLSGSKRIAAQGGRDWLIALLIGSWDGIDVVSGASFPTHAKALRELALRRRMVSAAQALLERAKDPTAAPADVLVKASQHLAGLDRGSGAMRPLSDALERVGRAFDAIQAGEQPPIIPTGIEPLDAVIGGLQRTLTVIGAYPGVGKSGTVARVIANIAKSGRRVGVVSLEDEDEWLPWRYLADESRVPQFVLQFRQLNGEQRDRAADAFEHVARFAGNVWIDDRSGLTPAECLITARDAVVNRGCEVVVVDHIGELRYDTGPRRDLEVAEALSDLRALAKSHDVPVVLVSHLRRKKDAKPDEPPRLDDFADASAVERKARVAIALTREPDSEELRAYVLKHTKGKAGRFLRLKFDGVSAMPTNEELPEPPPPPEKPKKQPKEPKKKPAEQPALELDGTTEGAEVKGDADAA